MHRKSVLAKFSLVLLTILLGVAPSVASEGVIEISQILIEDSGGFPLVIEGPGSYRLTANLEVTGSSNAIEVTAGRVTIDLNGFHIVGSGPKASGPIGKGAEFTKGLFEQTGIFGAVGTSVTVMNGSIEGFEAGVSFEGTGNVKKVTFTGNFVGVAMFPGGVTKGEGGIGAFGGQIENCKFVQNVFGAAGSGIVVKDSILSGNAIGGVTESSDCTITNNVFSDNLDYAVLCAGCTISGNKVSDGLVKGPASAAMVSAFGSLVTGNTIIARSSPALELDEESGWSNNVIVDETLGKGGPVDTIGGQILNCNLINGELYCPEFFGMSMY